MGLATSSAGRAEADVAVIGGGVVGLSVAHLAARAGWSAVLLERHARFGQETSTHNSTVLHAGIYYPPGSWKARLCVEGRRELAARLGEWRVPHRISGKLIVAVRPGELPDVERLAANARAGGVESCRVISKAEMRRIEPHVAGYGALYSPDSGVFDVAAYLASLAARAEAADALLLSSAPVVGLEPGGEGIRVVTGTRGALRAAAVVNAAGLWADHVARMAGNDAHAIHPCRGEYASVVSSRASLVRGLVYPVPQAEASLGVHFTRTVDGELWVGPTARYIGRRDDYESDRLALDHFHRRGRALVPSLELTDLRMGPSGIRPKRVPEGSPRADFLIERDPGVPGLIHLIGIESPGLTASPAIARVVVGMLADILE